LLKMKAVASPTLGAPASRGASHVATLRSPGAVSREAAAADAGVASGWRTASGADLVRVRVRV